MKVGPLDGVSEQPRGAVRSGVDANGKAWETTMQNTYGYFGGTKGVDGDAIDVFLGNDLDGWDGTTVFVVDQYNPDGSFDEHKVPTTSLTGRRHTARRLQPFRSLISPSG